MRLFRKLFAEKILRYYEGTEGGIRLIKSLPLVKKHIKEDAFGEKSKGRMAVGIISQLIMLLWEFIRKLLYVWLFMFIPYMIMAHFFPLIKLHQDTTIIYLFVMLSTICGSFSNTTIFAMGDRDYLMIRIMLISPYMNFLGKIVYKIATDLVYFTIILTIFGIPFGHSLALSIVTASLRPVGEMIAIIIFDKIKAIYNNRGIYNGLVMALCVIIAYGVPVFQRKLSSEWMSVVHPGFVIFMVLIGAGASFFLWWYKHYRKIMREAMYIKREM